MKKTYNFKPKRNLRNHIVMICDTCKGIVIVKREDYEKEGKLKEAVFLTDTCAGCQEEGCFYEDQWYYGEKGLINDF